MEETSFDVLLTKFYNKIEKDKDFFQYFNLTKEEAIELAKQRAINYLTETLDELPSIVTPFPYCDFTDYNEDLQVINFKMYKSDINLITELMFSKYMQKDIALMHLFTTNFIPSEVQVFSPANEKKAYLSLISALDLKNKQTISSYNSRNRITGKYKQPDFGGDN